MENVKFEQVKFIRLSTAVEMGYPRSWLMDVYRNPKLEIGKKMDMNKHNSPIVFNADKLEEYWNKQVRAERSVFKRRIGVC